MGGIRHSLLAIYQADNCQLVGLQNPQGCRRVADY